MRVANVQRGGIGSLMAALAGFQAYGGTSGFGAGGGRRVRSAMLRGVRGGVPASARALA